MGETHPNQPTSRNVCIAQQMVMIDQRTLRLKTRSAGRIDLLLPVSSVMLGFEPSELRATIVHQREAPFR